MAVLTELYGPVLATSGASAPTDATYITQTANATLSAEQALGSLASGLLKSATTTGVVSIATGGTDYALPGSASIGPRGIYSALGATASGLSLTAATTGDFWDDFVQAQTTALLGWFPQPTSGGTVTVNGITGFGGGMARIATSATANSIMDELALMGTIPPGIATKAWYQAFRFRIPTAIDAVTIAGFGLKNQAANKSVLVGVNGANSTVNFTVQYDGNFTGTFASLGVAIDTAFHVFELWSVGDGKLHTRVDGAGTDINVTMAAAPTDYAYPCMTVRNGITAADRQLDIDWQLLLFPRI